MRRLVISAIMPFYKIFLNLTKKVKCERKSVVYPSCSFEGMNRICEGTYISRSKLGYGSYVGKGGNIVSTSVGRFSCIGPNVRVTSGVHPTGFVSMHPAFYSTVGQAGFTYVNIQKYDEKITEKKYYTIIENDVWIGDSALILEGVHIGDGAVIAAGSVVTKNVPSYAVVAGVPAKVIKYRFSEEEIQELETSQWWEQTPKWLKENADLFSDISKFISSTKSLRGDQ